MKKILIVSLLIICAGCAMIKPQEATPAQVVNEEIRSFLDNEFGAYMGTSKDEDENNLLQQMAKMFSAITFTTDNEQISEDEASVDAHFQTYSVTNVFSNAMERILDEADLSDQTQLNKTVSKILLEEFISQEEKGFDTQFDYTFTLHKTEEGWELDDFRSDEVFIDGISGGMLSGFGAALPY